MGSCKPQTYTATTKHTQYVHKVKVQSMNLVHKPYPRTARAAAREARAANWVDVTLPKGGETANLCEHSPAPNPTPDADLLDIVSEFLCNHYAVSLRGRWYSLRTHRVASTVTMIEQAAIFVVERDRHVAHRYGLTQNMTPPIVAAALSRVEVATQRALMRLHRKLWRRRVAGLEQAIGEVLPVLASRPEHAVQFTTRKLTRIEDLIPSEPSVPTEDYPAPSVASAIEIPRHVARFVPAQ